MSRNGNGEGSIRKRPDGKWEARYTVTKDHRRRQESVYGKTREEVSRKLRAALGRRDGGQATRAPRETVAGYLTRWVAGVPLLVKPRTAQSYRQIVRDHLTPALGRIRLDRLEPDDLRELYTDLLESGRSPKTVRNVHVCLHRALEQGREDGVLARNVADSVRPPRAPRPEMHALDPDEVRHLVAVAREDPLEALWVVAVTAGLRQGELRALRWPELDLAAARVRVVATMEGQGSDAPLAEPKTKRSRRVVELTQTAVSALERHRKAQVAAGVLPAGFIFTRVDGRPLSAQQVRDRWLALLKQAGIAPVRFHDARHTAATLMLGRGVHPKLVSEMLGHASVAITLDLYSHATPTMHREAARAMDELLG